MAKGKFSLNFDAIEALFKPKMPPLIGADISSSAVKMVEIVDAGKGAYRLERYAIEPLPTESVVEGNINNLDAVIEAVKRCHKRLGSNFKNLALALPNAAVISKKILVPAGQTEAAVPRGRVLDIRPSPLIDRFLRGASHHRPLRAL